VTVSRLGDLPSLAETLPRKRFFVEALVPVLGELAFLVQVAAGPHEAAISGVVREAASRAPVPAHIEVECVCLPSGLTATAGEDGFFFVGELPAGVYSVSVEALGQRVSKVVEVTPRAIARLQFAIAVEQLILRESRRLARSRDLGARLLGPRIDNRRVPHNLDAAIRHLRKPLSAAGRRWVASANETTLEATLGPILVARWRLSTRSVLARWFRRRGVCEAEEMTRIIIRGLVRDVRSEERDHTPVRAQIRRARCTGGATPEARVGTWPRFVTEGTTGRFERKLVSITCSPLQIGDPAPGGCMSRAPLSPYGVVVKSGTVQP
jgi:hypothetical protein